MATTGSFIQIHLLTSYPAVLLNRDDAGLAKRMPFGDATRTRVSSQCLKKHWREAVLLSGMGPAAVRSRLLFETHVAKPLQEEHGRSPEEARAVAEFLITEMLSSKKDGDEEAGEDAEAESASEGGTGARTQAKQVLVFSEPEARWLTETALEILALASEASVAADSVKALKSLVGRKENKAFWKQRGAILSALPASFDVALFGRFVTSDLMARVDAAVSVAHALTTHAELSETDYFTAMDMLDDSSAGAGHLNDTELTSGVFYTYVVIDLEQLRSNLGPEAERTAEMVSRFIRTIATTGPRAKYGSTAPYALAEFVLIEVGDDTPRTLANAFRKAIRQSPDDSDILRHSASALLRHRESLGRMYGGTPRAFMATIHEVDAGRDIEQLGLNAAIAAAVGVDHLSGTRA